MSVPTPPAGYDLEHEIYTLVPPDIQNKAIEAGRHRMVQLKDCIKKLLLKIKREGWEHESISDNERNEIKELIWLYWKTEDFGPTFKYSPVCAESILKHMSSPTMRFPAEIQQIATIMLEIYDSHNWDIALKDEEPAEASKVRSKKRKAEDIGGKGVDGEASNATYTRAPTNHPIFGVNGIMHHVQLSKGGKTIAYRIDPEYTKKDFAVFGDNGIQVGEVWAGQIAALRDGAHGHRMAGISGNNTDGAYSIVVTGTYADIDIDNGDVIYYSVPGAIDTKDQVADRTKDGPKKLLRSLATKKPIRVIRKHDSKWEGAPRAGLRYDGLYEVTGSEVRSNDLGGKFLRFRHKRCAGQPAIDKSRPTRQERRAFEDVKLGY